MNKLSERLNGPYLTVENPSFLSDLRETNNKTGPTIGRREVPINQISFFVGSIPFVRKMIVHEMIKSKIVIRTNA
jgi:hypothetical protein